MVTLADVQAARERIRALVSLTPCPLADNFTELCGAQVHFKLEMLQRTGSFKERGAANKLALLTPQERKRGVVAASAGNHAQGVAVNAQRLGIRATIVMPESTPLIKVQATRKFGAEVVLHGAFVADAFAEARRLEKERDYVFVHAYDDDAVIAGQGTCALEILEQVPDVDVVVASVGGGGWLGGMALTLKALKPSVRVIGVESAAVPKMRAAREAGKPVTIAPANTLADGIAVQCAGERTFPLFQKYVDELVTVDDEEVANAILALIEKEKDVNLLARIIERGLVKEGRRVMLALRVPDRPGALASVLSVLAAERANVLEVHHNRAFMQGPIGDTEVELTLDTRGSDHVAALCAVLREKGYAVTDVTARGTR